MSEEMAHNANQGKHSPGPIYEYNIDERYKKLPKWGFGTASKMTEIKPKYDFYENDRFFDDPIEADQTRKKKVLAPRFGTEPRMPLNTFEKNPGPQYYPKDRPEKKKAPKFSFGFRRTAGGQGLINQTSTTKSVGPGRYVPEASSNPSSKKNFPKWTLSKAGRSVAGLRNVDKNQTYDTRSGVGKQQSSKNKSAPSAHFGTSSRDLTSKLGTFKDGMTGVMKVKMPHARW